MIRWIAKLVVGLALVAPSWAFAESVSDQPVVVSRGQGWSLYSGQTVGRGGNVISGQLGWPGLSFAYEYGASDRFDIGLKLTPINYGFEGIISRVYPGIKLQALARLQLVEHSRFNLGVEFAPGPLFYFPNNRSNIVGIALPLRLAAGIGIGSAVMANFGIDFPMFVTFGNNAGVTMPVLFGVGAEYFIDRRLAVSFNLKMGPAFYTSNADIARFGSASFDMEALVGVAYRL